MEQPSVIHNTFVIERKYAATPERVFAAFADPAMKRRWYAEGGDRHAVEVFESDFRVGGVERSRYRFQEGSPFPGVALSTEGNYQDIVPNQRIITASTMSMGDRAISVTLVTIELLPSKKGTELICTHQGAFFEGSGGPEMRERGWQTLFGQLERELAR
jgi:uncharacterized protein YndB with AHSA1/START domain